MLSKEEIKSIFDEEGFRSKFLQRFQIDEGIEDPVTGKKAAWTISWQLDTSRSCEYIEVTSAEQLREALQSEKHQQALHVSRASYLESKCMEANEFYQACVNAASESRAVVKAVKKIGKVAALSVQPDFYEPSMYCIAEGDQKITDESEYDERCIAGSMEKDVAIGVVIALRESGTVVKHIDILTKGGQTLVNKYTDLFERHDNLQDEVSATKKELANAQSEIESLKNRLDDAFTNAIASGEGEGNVTVADPKQFAKIIRVIEGLHDKIEKAQNGEEVSGLPVSGPGTVSKELLYFKSMIEIILSSVKG